MSSKDFAVIIDKLREDTNYYGEFGQKFLSNSDIGSLLRDPRTFRQRSSPTTAMIMGSYLHTKILEPHKLSQFEIIDATTRTTNVYRHALEESEASILLLKKEVEDLNFLCDCVTENMTFCDLIYQEGNLFEQPGLTTIADIVWKGKADILTKDSIVDLKTTASLDDFKRSAYKYNYDSQAFLYQQIFGVPMMFLAIEKKSGRTGILECSEQFLASGEQKVYQAMDVYKRFFGENATEDLSQFFIYSQL
jgi:hypothetical protein